MNITFNVSVLGALQLTPGQEVNFHTPLIKTLAQEGFRLEVAQELGIPNDKIFMHVSKIVGDTVEANEILAIKKSTFGTKQVASPKTGVIKQIDHETGSLVIETLSETSNVSNCYFVGTIKELNNSEITLQVKSAEKITVKDITSDFGGTILYKEEHRLTELTGDNLQNQVVFTETLKPADAVRLDVLGAHGIITRDNMKEREGINSAEIEDKNAWSDVIKTKHMYCLVDKKNSTMYLYSN